MSTRDVRDTSRPFTLKISLRALSRAGLAGAIQLLPNQRNVALYDPMPAEPRALGAVGHVTPFPQGQFFFREFLGINWIPSIMVFQGS